MDRYQFKNKFNINDYSIVNSEINVKWLDIKQFIREHNLELIKKYRIPRKMIVGILGDTDDLHSVSNKVKHSLLLYGSPNALKKFWILLIPGLNIIFLIAILLGYPSRLLRFQSILKNAYDIESNSKEYKLVRNSQGEIGLIYWVHCGNCHLLLKSIYSSIKYIDNNNIIVEKKNLLGLYNLRNRTWVLPCKYNSIINERKDIVIANNDEGEIRINVYGERIM